MMLVPAAFGPLLRHVPVNAKIGIGSRTLTPSVFQIGHTD
jgi:hypothetical protein